MHTPQQTFMIQYEVNDACNLRCSHCYHGLKQIRESPITIERMLNDIEELKAHLGPAYTITVLLSGGEVFLRKDLRQLVVKIMLKGHARFLLTNGTLVTPENAFDLLIRGVELVRISLDGGTPELHDKIRGQGQFAKALQGIRTFQATGQQVAISCTLMRGHNDLPEQIESLFQLARAEKLYKLNFFRMFAHGDGKETPQYGFDGPRWKATLESLWQLATAYPDVQVVIKDPLAKNLEQPWPPNVNLDVCCYIKKNYLSVAANGDVYACRKLEKSVGNLLNDSLVNIWKNNALLQQMADRRIYMEGKCQTCAINTECQGGCLAASYGQYGRLFVPDPACWKENPGTVRAAQVQSTAQT